MGYLDGTLAIYDLSTQSLRHKCQHEVLPSPQAWVGGLCVSLDPSMTSLGAQGLSWGQFPICASPSAPWASPKAAAVPDRGCAPYLGPGGWLSYLWRWQTTLGGHVGGAGTVLGVPSAHLTASLCPSRGSCSCCGRRARPWCTPAAWTGPCGSGMPARGR